MLKKRVDVCLLLNDGVLFRSRKFMLDYRYTLNFVDLSGLDELLICDVTRVRTEESRTRFIEVAKQVTAEAMLPTYVGGWVSSVEDVRQLLGELPCEGVIVGRAAAQRPALITEIAHKFGSQAITVAIDYREGLVMPRNEGIKRMTPRRWAAEAEECGAGQILLTNIDRDGSLDGYDLATLEEIAAAGGVPIMVSGGCGRWKHMADAFRAGADACVTTNVFHFTRTAIEGARKFLQADGIEVRAA